MTAQARPIAGLSIVVTTRLRSEGCRRLCTELDAQLGDLPTLDVEIVLVFDGCAPYDWVPASGRYRCVALEARHGIARARNVGIGCASRDVLAFLDDDAVPASGWLSSLFVALDAYPQMVAFGGRVIGSDPENLFGQLRDQVYYRETFGGWYLDVAATGDLMGPPYVNGGNSAYRREAMLDAGGFDGVLPAYSDVELGRRLGLDRCAALLAGMTIYHDHPAAFGAYMRRCYRSGRARGLLWSRYRYAQDAPGRVAGTIVANLLWNNLVRRARRITAGPVRAAIVLSCQEVLHGIGYVRSLVPVG